VRKRLEISVGLTEEQSFCKKQGNGIAMEIYVMRLLKALLSWKQFHSF
jgi:hypothetical protein